MSRINYCAKCITRAVVLPLISNNYGNIPRTYKFYKVMKNIYFREEMKKKKKIIFAFSNDVFLPAARTKKTIHVANMSYFRESAFTLEANTRKDGKIQQFKVSKMPSSRRSRRDKSYILHLHLIHIDIYSN